MVGKRAPGDGRCGALDLDMDGAAQRPDDSEDQPRKGEAAEHAGVYSASKGASKPVHRSHRCHWKGREILRLRLRMTPFLACTPRHPAVQPKNLMPAMESLVLPSGPSLAAARQEHHELEVDPAGEGEGDLLVGEPAARRVVEGSFAAQPVEDLVLAPAA